MKERYQPKYMKPERKKRRLPLSAYLTYVLIAALLLTGVSFSKFVTTGGDGDGAQVAAFAMKAEADGGQATDLDINTLSGERSQTYGFYVTNLNSEVSISYTVEIAFPKILPNGMTLSITDGDGETSVLTSSDGTYTFGPVSFPAGATENHTYTLTITGTDALTGTDTFENVTVSVAAQQSN